VHTTTFRETARKLDFLERDVGSNDLLLAVGWRSSTHVVRNMHSGSDKAEKGSITLAKV
jgi:hypothetical protein